mmetsp:Transcript_156451/g.379889  ORF Transcript_156451/g.379889 Transcript_156451/m.379889 type:complete len:457 (+) Transcript_156451:1-1371(+)
MTLITSTIRAAPRVSCSPNSTDLYISATWRDRAAQSPLSLIIIVLNGRYPRPGGGRRLPLLHEDLLLLGSSSPSFARGLPDIVLQPLAPLLQGQILAVRDETLLLKVLELPAPELQPLVRRQLCKVRRPRVWPLLGRRGRRGRGPGQGVRLQLLAQLLQALRQRPLRGPAQLPLVVVEVLRQELVDLAGREVLQLRHLLGLVRPVGGPLHSHHLAREAPVVLLPGPLLAAGRGPRRGGRPARRRRPHRRAQGHRDAAILGPLCALQPQVAALDVLRDDLARQPQHAGPHARQRLPHRLAVAAVHAHARDVAPGFFASAMEAVAVAERGRRSPPLELRRAVGGLALALLALLAAITSLPKLGLLLPRAVLPLEDLVGALVLLHAPLLQPWGTPNWNRSHGLLHSLAEAVMKELVLEDAEEPCVGVTKPQLMRPAPPLPLQSSGLRRRHKRVPFSDVL